MRAPAWSSDVQLYEEYPGALQRRRRAGGTAGCAATGRCSAGCCRRVPGGRRRRGEESALGAVAVEDLRQPAPQPRAAGADAAAAARLDRSWRRRGSGRWRCWRSGAGSRRCAPRWWSCCASRPTPLLRQHLRAARCTPPARASRRRCSRSPACRTRPASASTRSCARRCACCVTRRRLLEWTPSSEVAGDGGTRPAGCPCADVDRAGPRDRHGACCCSMPARRAGGRRADPAPVARVAAARLVAQPAARAPAGDALAGSRRRSCAWSRARPGRSSRPASARKTTGCRRTTSRRVPRRSLAHRTSPTNMGLALLANLAAYDFGYVPAGQLIAAHAQRVRHDGRAGALPRPLLQLVRHADAAAAAAAVRLDGRQRQPRRPPADAAAGPRRAGRTSRSSRRAGWKAWATRLQALLAAAPQRMPDALLALPAGTRCGAGGAARHARGSARQVLERLAAKRRAGPRAALDENARRRKPTTGRARSTGNAGRSPDDLELLAPPAAWPDARTRSRRCASWPRAGIAPAGAPHRGNRAARRCRRAKWRAWTTTSCTTRCGTCWRSATTSPSAGADATPSAGAMPATTTCSPRKRACAASSPSRRASCRRRAGSRSAAC